MNRRDTVIALLALGALPFAAKAQQTGKARRIGFLSPDTEASSAGQQALAQFPESLNRLGYQVGRNLNIEWRWGEAQDDKLPALAEELVRLRVDLIVARTTFPILAAKRATHTIPIVMLNANYPVELGLVESLARPGANVTGTSYFSPETIEKQLQILKEAAPKVTRLAILWNSNPGRKNYGDIIQGSLQRASTRLGMTLQFFEMSRAEEIRVALDRIVASRIDALWYDGQPLFRANVKQIVAFLLARRLASVGAVTPFADQGGLLSYTPDEKSFFDRTASFVDRILKGAKPADLPVEQPTKFNLVINLKTARAIGIKIPQSVLVLADRVIE